LEVKLTRSPHWQAPDPWLALDGECRGYETRSAAALDFCAYWDSSSSPEGADAETRRELLDAGPVCLDKLGRMLTCSANSTRTQRAGVYEMAYAVRPDRAFCSFSFFRSRMTAESTTSAACRAALLDRNQSCYTGCDTCTTTCTNPGLRGVGAAWKCSAGQPLMGTFAASVVSDAGFDSRVRHGADRQRGTPAIPSSIWKEQYDVLIQNDLNYPRVPRDSVSCRKTHLTDSFGAYVSPIDRMGRPVKRAGWHVGCQTSSQCHSRCGEHPILGESYVCVRNAKLFSYQGQHENGSTYYINEAGDDAFDVVNYNLTAEHLGTCMGETATVLTVNRDTVHVSGYFPLRSSRSFLPCVADTRYDFQVTGCSSISGAGILYGILGCTGRLGWASPFCGTRVERVGDDFLDSGIADSSVGFPRTIVEGGMFNGEEVPALTCESALTCGNICSRLSRQAREAGLPEPEACALCEPICPSDLGTTIVDAVSAFGHDVETAVRLVATCFGPSFLTGCVCNLMMVRAARARFQGRAPDPLLCWQTMKPAWLDNLPDPEKKCTRRRALAPRTRLTRCCAPDRHWRGCFQPAGTRPPCLRIGTRTDLRPRGGRSARSQERGGPKPRPPRGAPHRASPRADLILKWLESQINW